MKPPVIARGHLEGQFFILIIVLAHIHVKSVGRDVVEGPAGNPGLLVAGPAFLDVTVFHQFLFDLHKVILLKGNIQRRTDGFQMVNLCLCLLCQVG